MNSILVVILLTLAPFLELRASIPYGMIKGIDLYTLIPIVIITNILLAPVLFLFLKYFTDILINIKFIGGFYKGKVERTQKSIESYIKKYGVLGLSIFIGIPLPGSGVYTGAIGAYYLGFSLKRFFISAIIGVFIAAILVYLAAVFGITLFIK